MFRVAASATRPSDFIVDHRDYRVIGDAALARTIIVQHVAGPIPAVLHATPLRKSSQLPAKPRRYCRPSTTSHEPRTAKCVKRSRVMLSAGSATTKGAGHPEYIKQLS